MTDNSTSKHVYVTGAGFSRAFNSSSPLLIDDFGNEELEDRFRSLVVASEIFEAERKRNLHDHINIERLMTRLDQLMPYDYSAGVVNEYEFLLSELKQHLVARVKRARDVEPTNELITDVAKLCISQNATCITFNYDDLFDEALYRTSSWNPAWGYGFYCRGSRTVTSQVQVDEQDSQTLLLKLHGSVNWYPKLGASQPFAIDAIVHHVDWLNVDLGRFAGTRTDLNRHLEDSPMVVPPVVSKSALSVEPILRLVWTRAYEELVNATTVIFIGYSLPSSDTASYTMFAEALADLPATSIFVVGLENSEDGKNRLMSRYKELFGDIPDDHFELDGAVNWATRLKLQ